MKYLFILLVFFTVQLQAQSVIRGKVLSKDTAVAAASVTLGSRGTLTAPDGSFSFSDVPSGNHVIRVSAVGFAKTSLKVSVTSSDTFTVNVTLMKKDFQLDEVRIIAEREELRVKDSTVRMEVYSGAFLKRNLPENLMQIVNTMNGVQEQLNCGVCATSDIHINGLEGPNTLVLIDGMPVVSALSTVYGLNGIPASIIDRIEVTRGPSSAIYGTDAIAGTINVVTKSPVNAPKLEASSFVSSQLEHNTDVSYAFSGKSHSLLGSVAWFDFNKNIDRNLDGFTDVAQADRKTLFLKSAYHPDEKLLINSGARVYAEERWGGQLNWNSDFKGSDSVYGEWINTRRFEAFSSMINTLSAGKFKADLSAVYHLQDSYYGSTPFNADQLTLFTSVRYEKSFGNNNLIAGISQKYNGYKDNTSVSGAGNTFLPGIFAENEFRFFKGNLRMMPGARLDYYNSHGLIFSPRFNSFIKTGKFSRVQLSAGKGFRVVSVFTEDHAALTGSRKVVIGEKLNPESSWSSSATFNQALSLFGASNIEITGFYTYFSNQIIPDYSLPDMIVYANLRGYSISQGASLNFSGSFKFPLRYSAGITFIDAYEIDKTANTRSDILFAPDHTSVFQLSYRFKKIQTEISYSSKVYGPMALPEFPEPFARPSTSPVFSLHNLQIMKRVKALEFVFSVKNLFDYIQPSPLINPANPFSDSFDTSYIYGPLQGRRFVLSLRFTRF